MRFHEPTPVSPWFAVVAGLLTLLGTTLWLLELSLGKSLMILAASE